MPFDGSGNFTLASNTLVSTGTASSTYYNNTANDYASAFNAVMLRNGAAAFTAAAKFADGTTSTPGLAFSGSPSTGIYRDGSGNIAFAVSGTTYGKVTSSGITDSVGNIISLSAIATGKVLGNLTGGSALPTAITAVGQQTIWQPAGGMIARTTNGPTSATVETTTNKINLKTLNFDPTTAQYAQFTVAMPKSWNNGTVTAQFFWSHPSTTTNFGTVWGIQGVFVASGGAQDVAFGTAQTVTSTGGTTDAAYISTATAAVTISNTPVAGGLVTFQVYRDAPNGSDTLAVAARLQGVKLFYTTTAMTDD